MTEYPEVFDHVGLLFNEPPGRAELLFIQSSGEFDLGLGYKLTMRLSIQLHYTSWARESTSRSSKSRCDALYARKNARLRDAGLVNAIRDRIDRFHQMNGFGDQNAAQKLARLKAQISGLTGQDLSQQPDIADKLSRACVTLKNHILDPAKVSKLTGRLKRRVVLD